MGKIKVLHIFRNLEMGGAQRLIIDIYKNIDKEKIEFDFLVSDEGKCDNEVLSMGCKIYKIPYLTKVGQVKYKKELKKFFLNHREYNIIHSHIDQVSGIIMEAAKESNVKYRIAHSHNTKNSNGILGKIYKYYLQLKILKYANKYIGCSYQACKWLFKSKHQEALVLNNGIEIEEFKFNIEYRNQIRDEFNIKPNALLIGNVGRLVKQKNQRFLLKVFKQYIKENSNAYLMIVGEGPLKKQLENKSKNIKDNIIFVNNRKDINKFYSAFDLMIITSKYEGFGITYTESRAASLKCIIPEHLNTILKPEENNENIVKYLSIKSKKSDWIKTIQEITKDNKVREKNNNILDYDIKEVSKKLEQYYLEMS